MALPAVVSTSALWSDWLAARHGPFNLSAALYVLLVDKAANKVRAFRSIDQGNTWAEQDSANAPASGATASFKTIECHASGTDIYAVNVLSSTSLNILVFHTATDTWGTVIAGPTITLTTGGGPFGVGVVVGGRISVAGADYIVIVYNGAAEVVMSSSYDRVKLHQYAVTGGTWTGPFDVQGSANTPPANTLPGVQNHIDLRCGGSGVASRFHIMYENAVTGAVVIRHRAWTAGQFVAAAVDVVPNADNPAGAYACGPMGTYATSGGSTGIACVYGKNNAAPTKIARCDSATADVSTSWVLQQISNSQSSTSTNGPPGCVAADSQKLWTWITDASQQVFYADDAGAGTWGLLTLWKGANDVYSVGSSALRLSDSIGVIYDDRLGTPAVSQSAYDTPLNLNDVAANTKRAQSIRFTTAKTLKSVRAMFDLQGNGGGQIACQVFTDTGVVPSATSVGSLINTAPPVSGLAGGPPFWVTFFFSTNVSLSANTTYWLVFTVIGALSTTNYWRIYTVSSDQYTSGNRAVNNGTTWTAEAASAGDLAFTLHTVEDSPERVRFDKLAVFAPKVSNVAGSSVSAVYDLGDPPPAEFDLLVDISDAGANITGTVTVTADHSWDQGGWQTVSQDVCEPGAQNQSLVALNNPARYVRVTLDTAGADSTGGVAGV